MEPTTGHDHHDDRPVPHDPWAAGDAAYYLRHEPCGGAGIRIVHATQEPDGEPDTPTAVNGAAAPDEALLRIDAVRYLRGELTDADLAAWQPQRTAGAIKLMAAALAKEIR